VARWAFWILAAVYFALFFGWFHSARLFGTGDTPEGRQRRYYLLGVALTPSPESALVDLGKRLAVTDHLHYRIPLIGAASLIWIAAILAGDAFLCLLLNPQRKQGKIGGWTRFAFAFGLGMGLLSLVVLGLGLAGRLTQNSAMIVAAVIAGCWVVLRLMRAITALRRHVEPVEDQVVLTQPERDALSRRTKFLLLLVMATFAFFSLLSAFLPTTDYDAIGYHLLAPREWFEAGRIHFLPHNVYASFPFLTEMFHLLGMTIIRDWFAGGLVGQVALWAFGPMGALVVGLLASRWFGSAAGWLAALIYISTPWVFRLSAIPYVEGALLFFGALALLAFAGWKGSAADSRLSRSESAHFRGAKGDCRFLLVGAAVGCAAACKYTSIVMLGVPFGIAVLRESLKSRTCMPLLAFALGVAIFFGPWLARNAAWTGNLVYPLAYSIFGGKNWTPEKAAKFAAGHRSDDFSFGSAGRYLAEIPVHSDWQSGLVFALAPIPLAVCLFRRRSHSESCIAVSILAGLIVWQFIAFYSFTHRLDRFWLPLLPYACVLAGAGWTTFPPGFRGWLVNPLACIAILFNFCYCTTSYCALNDYTANLMEHRRFSKGRASKAVLLADESGHIPPGATVLFVGFSGVYYSDHPFRYNSVFDDALVEKLAFDPALETGLRSLPELRRRFRELGVDYVVVDWEWVRKYKGPGNYGYSDFVTPERFDRLVETGLLWRLFSETRDMPDEKKSTELKLEIYQVLYEPRR
jgi:4-amino-4-deoxy-L-arabinose transferase-like glycosyltransferase